MAYVLSVAGAVATKISTRFVMLQTAATCSGVKPKLPSARPGSAPAFIRSRTIPASLLLYRHARVSGVLPSWNMALGLGGTALPASASRTLLKLPILTAAASFMSRAVGAGGPQAVVVLVADGRTAVILPLLCAGGCCWPPTEEVGAAEKDMCFVVRFLHAKNAK